MLSDQATESSNYAPNYKIQLEFAEHRLELEFELKLDKKLSF